MEITFVVRDRSWIVTQGLDRKESEPTLLAEGVRGEVVAERPLRGGEQYIIQLLFEQVLTPVTVSILAAWLYDKMKRDPKDVISVRVGTQTVTNLLPEELEQVITEQVSVDLSVTKD